MQLERAKQDYSHAPENRVPGTSQLQLSLSPPNARTGKHTATSLQLRGKSFANCLAYLSQDLRSVCLGPALALPSGNSEEVAAETCS